MKNKYINEAVSLNGKIAYNVNNVSFKTNSVNGILQHLAWQYNDTFVGTIKKFTSDESVGLIANAVTKLSSNGSPLIFDELSESPVSFDIEAGESVQMLHLYYMFTDKVELMEYIKPQHIEFIVLIVNGIWFVVNKIDNELFFDKFDEVSSVQYVSTELPNVKIPKEVSEIDNVGTAKSALRAYAKENNLQKFAISSFTPTSNLEILGNPSMSKFSTFMPDINEFMKNEMYATLIEGQEIPYLVDEDNKRILFINLGSTTGNKWYLINDKTYVDFITRSGQNYFVDSVKNAIISSELNQGIKVKELYELITRLRAVSLVNKLQPRFDKSGYFYTSEFGKTLQPNKFTKLNVDAQGNVVKIINTKEIVIYKDTIVLYTANLENNIVVFSLPKNTSEIYITNIDSFKELYNEFYNYDPYDDTVLSISDVYFTDSSKQN